MSNIVPSIRKSQIPEITDPTDYGEPATMSDVFDTTAVAILFVAAVCWVVVPITAIVLWWPL